MTVLIWGGTLGRSKTEGELKVLMIADFHRNTLEARKALLLKNCSNEIGIIPLTKVVRSITLIINTFGRCW